MHERVNVEGNSIRMLKSPKTSSEQLEGGISLEAIVKEVIIWRAIII